MANLTFATYKAQTKETLQLGVINVLERSSDLLSMIPIETTDSLLYKFNTAEYQNKLSFVEAGQTFENGAVDSEATILELKHLGTYADVPLQYVKGQNVADLRANQTELKAENFAQNLEENIFYADGTGLAFKGYDKFITDGVGTAVSGALSYDVLCEVVDAVPNANVIFCNRKTMRSVEKMLKAENYFLGNIVTEGGKAVKEFGGLPIFCSETIKDNELFVMEFSTKGCGLLSLGDPLAVTDLGLLENQPIYRTMIEGSFAPIVRQKKAISKLSISASRKK